MPSTYRVIVDQVAAEIATGTLRAGDRLPPQRDFADRHGIAVSTASRVYSELVRRGLVVGEVGRGTYVRASAPVPVPSDVLPSLVNLEVNLPVLPGQEDLLVRSLAPLVKRRSVLGAALKAASVVGSSGARQTVAAFLSRRGWAVRANDVCFAGNGKQALAAAIAGLVPAGGRLGVEAVTYSMVKVLAARLGVTVVPLAMDDEGIRTDMLAATHRKTPLAAIYCQPTLHNPLGISMSAKRRADLAAVLERHQIIAIEDLVYAFLADDEAPLAAYAPEHTVVVDSLSKRVAPGISIGYLVAPPTHVAAIAAAVRAGAWGPSGLSMELCVRWIADGTAAALSADKRRDAAARQRLLRKAFVGLTVQANPKAYHAWLVMSERWRADSFVVAAARHGVGITPAAAFTVSPGHAPNAVRIALASPEIEVLESSLRTLAALARLSPRDWETE